MKNFLYPPSSQANAFELVLQCGEREGTPGAAHSPYRAWTYEAYSVPLHSLHRHVPSAVRVCTFFSSALYSLRQFCPTSAKEIFLEPFFGSEKIVISPLSLKKSPIKILVAYYESLSPLPFPVDLFSAYEYCPDPPNRHSRRYLPVCLPPYWRMSACFPGPAFRERLSESHSHLFPILFLSLLVE